MTRRTIAAVAVVIVATVTWCSLSERETAPVDDPPAVKQAREAAETEIERRRQDAQRRVDAATERQ